MRKIIHIAQFASGSRTDNIGDTTLFYSAGFSKHANDVSGLFLDNPPVLSPRYASLIWRYYADVDQYIAIHVQGSHVVNSAMGRSYPFRAGYEVSRDDMNAIDYQLSSLFRHLPRIHSLPSGRVKAETEITIQPQVADRQTLNLAANILHAITSQKRLFVSLEVSDDDFRNDGVWDSVELGILLSAIESMPLSLRRYMTFGFCVDEHHAILLEDLPVVVYVKGSKMTVPAGAIQLSWQEAVKESLPLNEDIQKMVQDIHLPGAQEPILPMKRLFQSFAIYNKDPKQLHGDDWPLWLSLGHHLEELKTNDWKTYGFYLQQMDETTQTAYAEQMKKSSLSWPVEHLDNTLFTTMNYHSDEFLVLQKKTLKDYLWENRFAFLFTEGVTEELKNELNASFLQRLSLNDKQSVERWYDIFHAQNALDDERTLHTFGQLLGQYGGTALSSLDEIVNYMKRYPFIPATAFHRPAQLYLPSDLPSLSPTHQSLINGWVKAATSNIHFSSIDEIVSVIRQVSESPRHDQSLEELALQDIDPSSLGTLLRKGKAEEVLDHCETILDSCCQLPESWQHFVTGRVIPLVSDTLFNHEGVFKREKLLTVTQWPSLSTLMKSYPHLQVLIQNRMEELYDSVSCQKLSEQIIDTFVTKASLKQGKNPSQQPKPVGYKHHAEEAYPIIQHYIATLKKQDTKMAKDVEKLFKDLKNISKSQNKSRRSSLFLFLGLILGVLLTIGGWIGFQHFFPKKATPQDTTIECRALAVKPIEKGKTIKEDFDTLRISTERPLLASVCEQRYIIHEILIGDTLRIEIPNKELLDSDSLQLTTLDSKYYFRLVRYIQSKLPEHVKIAY